MAINRKDLVNLLVEMRPNLPDQLALKYAAMFPKWADNIGLELTADMIREGKNRFVGEDGKLYRADKPHTLQADWKPGIETLSLYVVIDVAHAGTLEDPIPASAGMEYEYGKYYSEGEAVYLMNRQGMNPGEKIVLAFLPSQLVGHYFAQV